MSVFGCVVVAVDGTHSAGKSTLAGDLAAHYRAAGIDVGFVEDQARDSPLVAAVVAEPGARFSLAIELDLIAATISQQLRAAADRRLLVVDKTAANVIAYARLFLTSRELSDPVMAAAETLCRAWQPYDLVIRCTDRFPIDLNADGYRSKVTELQDAAEAGVAQILTSAGYPRLDLPAGLDPAHRVQWLTRHPKLTSLVPTPAS